MLQYLVQATIHSLVQSKYLSILKIYYIQLQTFFSPVALVIK